MGSADDVPGFAPDWWTEGLLFAPGIQRGLNREFSETQVGTNEKSSHARVGKLIDVYDDARG